MIVVVNPSTKAGHSFRGLHAYCSHDQERAQTSERVDWISTRNIGIEDPDHAWKIMVSTAHAQNQLKQSAGIRTGKSPKDGAVMHVVMSFDKDEPTSRQDMQIAANELLAELGADPAKMRSKNKPKRRQFADEHQAVIYAHADTKNAHLHLMINRIHPQTGVVLPSNNDHLKAQNWALEYSKRHGTDKKTPARDENNEDRKNGEYVKAKKRKSRNAYERDQRLLAASNDNDRLKEFEAKQRAMDADLAKRGRTLSKKQSVDWNGLVEEHRKRKSDLAGQLQSQINKVKAAAREKYRPLQRELRTRQEAERKTFKGLEVSFFGRAANAFKALRVSKGSIGGHETGLIKRTFKVATDAGVRKQYFDAAQERARAALEREQHNKAQQDVQELKVAQEAKFAANRAYFKAERAELKRQQEIESQKLKSDWHARNLERQRELKAIPALTPKSERTGKEKIARVRQRKEYQQEFKEATQRPVPVQDNSRSDSGGGDSGVQKPMDQDSLRKSYAEIQRQKAAGAVKRREDRDKGGRER